MNMAAKFPRPILCRGWVCAAPAGSTALLLMLLGGAPPARAATCTVSAPAMMLGNYTGALSASGMTQLSVTCPSGAAYSILMGLGGGSGATITNRKMTGPTSPGLTYMLFQDSARTMNWGETANTDTVNSTGTGAVQTFSIFPQIPPAQAVTPGAYSDSVLMTASGNGLSGSATLSVTATVLPSCSITASNLAFGTYIGAVLDAATTLTALCTNTTPYTVGLSAGNGTAATVTTRRMQGPDANGLQYALFRDAARTLNWGTTVNGDTVAGTGSGSSQTLTVYGQVPADQRVTPGDYVDTIVVTLTY